MKQNFTPHIIIGTDKMFEGGEKDFWFTHTNTHALRETEKHSCLRFWSDFFEAIVIVMWFRCEGSKHTDRNSGPQMKNTTKPSSLVLHH